MKKVLVTVAASLAMATAWVAPSVGAWSYTLNGTGACQSDGSFLITWDVNNTTMHRDEWQPLNITASSDHTVVPVPNEVGANSHKTFTQTVDGTKTGSYSLSVTGHWRGDRNDQTHRATVEVKTACEQPGKGGDTPTPPTTTTTTPTTPTTPAATTSVAPAVVPVGSVSAGEGGASTGLNVTALTALVGSAAAVFVGVLRRVQKG